MSNLEKPLLDARDLIVGYPSGGHYSRPVNGASLTIRPREVVGLIGDAGSGKSTLALALMGLVQAPGRILGGSVEFGGQDLTKLSEDELRAFRGRDISAIVQNPRGALNPLIRIGEQISNAYRAHTRATPAEGRAKAIEMLTMVGINDPERRVNAYAHELSGGMAQRAMIAMALAAKPRLLIADEPTSGLDVTIQAQLLDQMWQTVQDTESAILLVSQDLGAIANYCDRVLALHDGKIVEDAPVRQFFAMPQHDYSKEILGLHHAQGDRFPEQVSDAANDILEVEKLRMEFPVRNSDNVVHAVGDFRLNIKAGEAVGLVGESGSGKTTVGRCLVRLLDPTESIIRFDGFDIGSLDQRSMRKFRSRIQFVFQDPFDSVNPRWSVSDILIEPLRQLADMSRAERRKRAEEVMELVGLPVELLERKPRGLGAGILQRINIARALICEPEFLVLDEPTSVLAPRARNALIELLGKLQKELGIALLFITHDLTTVRYLCQRVAVMYLGQIVEEGSVEQVFTAPRHPYSQALLEAHLFPDPDHRRVDHPSDSALDGEIPSPIDLPTGCYLASRCPHADETCRSIPQNLSVLSDGQTVRCWKAEHEEEPAEMAPATKTG
ncbi:dipeptide ABC transporter ATP-binding protein [Celeribacter litoreus]|uniref:dipeptide ABC transporter ATP-binding protein n=1 Tax=Celeribacter litoreus TaxID=2876714 RepID=UPI001CCC530F|nr:ABC transporter ATP-binding protein [Celeribacter litoreus]MCA0042523.1 ABC transporter ATP-binding protein [Celeribacter litoreus]